MGAIFFDTQRGFEKLRNAGVGEEQAKAQIDLFRDAMSDRLATRDDLQILDKSLNGRMDQLEKRMDDLEKRLLEWRLELRAEIAQISKNLRMHTTIVAGSMAATIIVVLAALMTLLK